MRGFRQNRSKWLLGAGASVLVLCGFLSPASVKPKLPANALAVPIVRQATTYSCGPAALLALLQYWGKYDGNESSLYASLNTDPKQGTHPNDMTRVAGEFGLTARVQQKTTLAELRAALGRGETVLVDYQAWPDEPPKTPWTDVWEDGHYSIVVGMDRHYLYFMDPSMGVSYTYLPIEEFVERWHDYEDRTGVVNRYLQLAIFIKGDKAQKVFPGPIQPTE